MRQAIPKFEEILSVFHKECTCGNFLAENTQEQCEKLAVLNLNDKANCTAADELDAIEKENNGEWIKSSSLRGITTHLQLLDALLSENHKREEDIIANLLAHIGNAYYYRMEDLDQLFGLAAQLYEFSLVQSGIGRMRLFEAERDDYVKLRIRNAKFLMRCGYTLGVKAGEVDLPEASEQAIVNFLDAGIASIGGLWFITALFEQEIKGKYHKGLERYLIMRDKRGLGDKRKLKESVPYVYLLQLGMKHLEEANSLLTEQGRHKKYEEILRVASSYLEILNFQGHSVMEDLFYSYEHFPMVLSCNMLYEKLCIPRQYHPDYVELLITKLLGSFYMGLPKDKQKFLLDDYVKVMKYIFRKANGPVIIAEEEMLRDLQISRSQLKNILDEISFMSSAVNQNFAHYLDATNIWKRPLVRLSGNRYFCLDARMASFAFYEVLYQLVYKACGKMLNRKLGEKLEEVVYGMFEDKKIPFVKGKYQCLGELPERDCDMIMEGDKQLLFMEIKKIPLPESYETGDDVSVLETLERGMLYAQEQVLWHRLRLHQYGVIELEDAGKHIEVRDSVKQIYSISVCMPEYDFLSDQMIVKSFLESTLFVSYHAHDTARENDLQKLNKRMECIRELAGKIFDGQPYTSQQVFFNASFMSLQQLWMALRFYPTKERFLSYCSSVHAIHTGLDVYGNMWYLRKF